MILRLRNKTLMALDKLINSATNQGGIPKHIEFSFEEARLFCKEFNDLHHLPPSQPIKICDEKGLEYNFIGNVSDFINAWHEKKYSVQYKQVPIIVKERNAPTLIPAPTSEGDVKYK